MQSRVRFNRVPKKVLEKVVGGFRFNGVPEKVPEKIWKALVQSRVRLNRVPEKTPEKVCCRARSGSTGFRRRFPEKVWEALVQSQVRFNGLRKVAEKVPKKVLGIFSEGPGQVQRVQ